MKPKMTEGIARSIGQDEANRQMRLVGRKVWNREDYVLACGTFNKLWPEKSTSGFDPFPPKVLNEILKDIGAK